MAGALDRSRIFLLDGIWGSHRRWQDLSRKLEAQGASVTIWHYRNTGFHPITELAAELVHDIASTTEEHLYLVGYSMGGLVVREALRLEPFPRIRKVAFLHSPLRGSLSSYFVPLPGIRDMRPGSPFLRRQNEAPWGWPTLVTWCPFDLMVLPGQSANWPRANKSICSLVPAHAWPVVSHRIHRAVVDFFCEGAHPVHETPERVA